MLFSIVIPFKETNIEYTKNCLKSLEEQHFKDFEVLFVYHDPTQINYLFEETILNYQLIQIDTASNVSVFRNKGLAEARGEYVLFLDSDDFLHPNTLIYTKKMIDNEYSEVIRLKVKGTRFDKKTTLNKNNQAFYKDDTSAKLDRIFDRLDINIEGEKQTKLINELFEEDLLNANYKLKTQNKFMRTLSRSLKVHGFIFQRQFLVENELLFDESNDLYGEIPFLLQTYNEVLSIQETTVSLYYKLLHNDSINYPSLSQEIREDRFLQFYRALKVGLLAVDNLTIAKQVKRKAINYYLYTIAKSNSFSAEFNKLIPLYQELQEILNIDSEPIKLARRHNVEIASIKRGKFKRAYFFSKARVTLYQIARFLKPKNKKSRRRAVQRFIISKLPIRQNTVLYESFLGKNYSDSPKAIFKYLLANQSGEWRHIWVINDKDLINEEKEFQQGEHVKVIKRFSWKYFYYVTVSKYFVLNMRQPPTLYKKDEQIILSTWHGTPLKRLVFDMENVASANPKYKSDFYQQSRDWDYLIAANKYSESIFESAFMYPREQILTYGYPRNDVLMNFSDTYKEQIKTTLGIPLEKKVILYAPTWRDDEYHKVGKYKFNLTLDLNRLEEELGDEYVIILRMHYFISDNIDLSEFEGFAYDYSKYNDINDLYIASDLLITDYSSVFFDFANLRKPILFFTYDIDKYRDMLRGFYIDMEKDLPGPLLYTSEEVVNSIKNIDQLEQEYADKYNDFYNIYCSLDDGYATERVVKQVFDSSKSGK
ncbi:CDP-glycerol:glycerophosphate glycerophosphotransferase [Gracilibacillus phocaeensis]|uniref:CDP-glycerol:glycerophosphate glycerophosphotransferase n=1 Tax=Gracilibacillus phocaeensis TaxID=2042304 RepID=UPI00102F61D1|nr:CDP-glycerol:glycerophosphate glycerophosphotransferase [Gracilibacillus phocaeensis]